MVNHPRVSPIKPLGSSCSLFTEHKRSLLQLSRRNRKGNEFNYKRKNVIDKKEIDNAILSYSVILINAIVVFCRTVVNEYIITH